MKIRNGFVSNSSSSSFIINAEGDLSTVKDVAMYIITTILKEGWQNYDNEIKCLDKMSDSDTPVFFNTGGDETYIRKHDGKIVISTTQNVHFQEIENKSLEKNQISEDYYYKKFNDFLILEHNFFGRHIYIDNCPNCCRAMSKGWIFKNNNKLCECQLNKILRSEKLHKINEVQTKMKDNVQKQNSQKSGQKVLGYYGPSLNKDYNKKVDKINSLIDEYNSKINNFSTYSEQLIFSTEIDKKINELNENQNWICK